MDPIDPPAPPLVTTIEWLEWYDELLESRIDAVSFPRDETRFVSSSLGDDQNDGLTPESAWASVEAAREWIESANPENQTREVLFRRGDVWRTRSIIDTEQPGVRFADFGDSAEPAPYFTGFTGVAEINDMSWTQLGDEPVFWRHVPGHVSWVREDGDADLDAPLAKQYSAHALSKVAGSWWWDSATSRLLIHPREEDDPRQNGKTYEWAFSNEAGFSVGGDLSLVENLRADGFGLDPVVTAPQREAFQSTAKDDEQVVFRNCTAYYGGSHVIAHNASGNTGGIATFFQCVAGFTKRNGSGETVFNTFAGNGGNQTIFHECTVARGTLPEGFDTGRRSDPVFGHTLGGAKLGLTIVYGLRVIGHPHGAMRTGRFNNTQPAASLEEVRCFIVGSKVEGGDGTGDRLTPLFQEGTAYVNCSYSLKPHNLGSNARLQSNSVDGWWINSTLDLDLSNQTYSNFDLYRTSENDNKARCWNSAITLRNVPPGVTVRLDGGGAQDSPNATFFNTAFSKLGSEGEFSVNLPNAISNICGNAYWQVEKPTSDSSGVELSAPPDFSARLASDSPLGAAGKALPGGLVLEFDQTQSLRFHDPPTIGPLEVATVGADLNQDGVVNGSDLAVVLASWGSDQSAADLNADGIVNGADLALLLAAWSP